MAMWRFQLSLRIPVAASLIAAILFGSAGRWDIPFFWACIGLWAAFAVVAALTVDRDLMQERLRPGAGGRDNLRLLRGMALLIFVSHWIIAGLDVGRFHWSDTVPTSLQIVGLAGLAAGLATWRWAMQVNRFFSSAVRIQRDRGHYVVTEGPYRFVRHPGYAALLGVSACSGLALGSWLSLLPCLILAILFLRRTWLEDRMLRAELAGYPEYAARVRYRLVL